MSYLVQATGRRKRAVARVRLHAGTGEVTINAAYVQEKLAAVTQDEDLSRYIL